MPGASLFRDKAVQLSGPVDQIVGGDFVNGVAKTLQRCVRRLHCRIVQNDQRRITAPDTFIVVR